jgi:hypothetical protein
MYPDFSTCCFRCPDFSKDTQFLNYLCRKKPITDNPVSQACELGATPHGGNNGRDDPCDEGCGSEDKDGPAKVTYGNLDVLEIESVGDVYHGRRPEQGDGD